MKIKKIFEKDVIFFFKKKISVKTTKITGCRITKFLVRIKHSNTFKYKVIKVSNVNNSVFTLFKLKG